MGIILGIGILAALTSMYPAIKTFMVKKIKPFRWKNTGSLFEHQYLDSKVVYLQRFRKIPSITLISEIDVTKAFEYIQSQFKEAIADVYQSCYFNREEGKQLFSKTVFVLRNKVIVELEGHYVEVFYQAEQYGFTEALITALNEYKVEAKKEAFEINIITTGFNGLELKTVEIQPTSLDIDLYYNDDFKEVDGIIKDRLQRKDDKGIILLHGLPGTGKTTYLRHLIGGLKKKVLFVSPSVAGNLMNPEFIDLLIDNPNAVLVIEDAENIIMDRKISPNSSVSNLLNLSDGLLSDCLNVQIICTFNNSLSMVDEALMRKGRLIARYEFGKLSSEKAQRLSDKLGLKQVIRRPMTLAEVTNPDEKSFDQKEVSVIGFRRTLIEA